MAEETKVFENRMRRAVARQGYRLTKSRVRDPRAVDFGRYYIVDGRNQVIAGLGARMMLKDVERLVAQPGGVGADKLTARQRQESERQVRQTCHQMLADFARLIDAIPKTRRLQELAEWLKVKEYEQEFRHYFKGGIADLRASVESAPRAIDALNAIIAPFPKGPAPRRGKGRSGGVRSLPPSSHG
jgi:hypothetical protein